MEITIVRVTQGNIEVMDFERWITCFPDWVEPELEIGQTTTFIVTRTG